MKNGIDISEFQGNLTYDNFKSIKDSGIEFIIIRCGYTSYGKNKTKYKDKYFENNYNLAKQLDIPVGTYYYSCATTVEEAIEEANFILELVNGKVFEYPICIDTEDNHDINNINYSNTSQYSIGKDKLTEIISTICKTVEKDNKYVSIYASTSWFRNNLVLSLLEDFDKWIAQWSNSVTFESMYGMWQYSSKGSVNGIGGYVDLDRSYKDYPNIMKSMGFNGYIKTNETPIENKPESDFSTDENNGTSNDSSIEEGNVGNDPSKKPSTENTTDVSNNKKSFLKKLGNIFLSILNSIKIILEFVVSIFKK